MTRERAKQLLPVITAFANGETIEARYGEHDTWDAQPSPGFQMDTLEYRIKPKPQYRPWTRDEVPVGAVLTEKCSGDRWMILAAVDDGIRIPGGPSTNKLTFAEALDRWTLADGTPCGILQ